MYIPFESTGVVGLDFETLDTFVLVEPRGFAVGLDGCDCGEFPDEVGNGAVGFEVAVVLDGL